MADTRNGSDKAVDLATVGAHHEWLVKEEARLSQAAVDSWLNEKLQMLYGPVLSEPIPEQLTQLIAAHRRNEEDC